MAVQAQKWTEVDFVRAENEDRLKLAARQRVRRILAAAANAMAEKFEADLSAGFVTRLALTDEEIDDYFRRGVELALPKRTDTGLLNAGR